MDLTQSFVYTVGMDSGEIAAHLQEHRTGALSLADDGRSYAVPVSYAVDDAGHVFLRLGDGATSHKLDATTGSEDVSFLVYDDGHRTGDGSWSVSLRGGIVEVDESVVPGTFDAFRVFDEDVASVSLRYFRLLDTERIGRRACR